MRFAARVGVYYFSPPVRLGTRVPRAIERDMSDELPGRLQSQHRQHTWFMCAYSTTQGAAISRCCCIALTLWGNIIDFQNANTSHAFCTHATGARAERGARAHVSMHAQNKHLFRMCAHKSDTLRASESLRMYGGYKNK